MQSFQRVVTLFSILIAAGFLFGCGGPGAPVSGGSDAATEAANAALAPEGGPTEEGAPDATAETSSGDAAPAPEATEPAAEGAEAASAPESEESAN